MALISELAHEMNKAYLLSDTELSEIKAVPSDIEKAGKIVSTMKRIVKLNSSNFEKFVDILKKKPQIFESIIKLLSKTESPSIEEENVADCTEDSSDIEKSLQICGDDMSTRDTEVKINQTSSHGVSTHGGSDSISSSNIPKLDAVATDKDTGISVNSSRLDEGDGDEMENANVDDEESHTENIYYPPQQVRNADNADNIDLATSEAKVSNPIQENDSERSSELLLNQHSISEEEFRHKKKLIKNEHKKELKEKEHEIKLMDKKNETELMKEEKELKREEYEKKVIETNLKREEYEKKCVEKKIKKEEHEIELMDKVHEKEIKKEEHEIELMEKQHKIEQIQQEKRLEGHKENETSERREKTDENLSDCSDESYYSLCHDITNINIDK